MDKTSLELIAALKSDVHDDQKIFDAIESIRNDEKSKSLDELFGLSLDLICIIDTSGILQRVSDSFEHAMGYPKSELLTHSIAEFIPDRDKISASEALLHLRKGISHTQFECRFLTKAGYPRWLSWRAVVLPGNTGVLVIARDTTSQKESIERLKNFSVQLHEYQLQHEQSLRYASMLQTAMMPDPETLKQFLPDAFIFYQPKDIVSGDFFWFDDYGDKVFITAADCTGHGVPGALLSILGINTLHSGLNTDGLDSTAGLMRHLDATFDRYLGRKFGMKTMNDGMDISICMIDRASNTLNFCGANNPAYVVRNGEVIRLAASRYSLGSNAPGFIPPTQTLALQKGDMIYLLSDGYVDQFGGEEDRRFSTKRFKELLVAVAAQPTAIQKNTFSDTWEKWKGSCEQTDDILLIGIRV